MADSDDEFDRRNAREKFRPERNDYERRGPDDRRGVIDDNWANRGRDVRRDGFDRGRRFSPSRQEGSPPQVKRMRRDWEEGGAGYPHYEAPPYGALPPPPVAGGPLPPPGWVPGTGDVSATSARGAVAEPEIVTQPAMMTFKQFLSSQDDNITDDEAIKRFGEYKMDFRKQQINDFFVQHKDEEWFRSKYHPEDYDKRREEAWAALLKRCEVFTKLMQLKRVAGVSVDADHSQDIIKLLDAAVIFLEGGTEFDLKALEETVNDSQGSSRQDSDEAGKISESTAEQVKSEKSVVAVKKPKRVKVKKIRRDSANGSESETGSLSDSEDEEDEEDGETEQQIDSNITDDKVVAENGKRTANMMDPLSQKESGVQESKDADTAAAGADGGGEAEDGMEEGEERDEPKPRPLHRTQSIFLRTLPPLVTRQEIDELCKRYPGFMRLTLQDPLPERKFLRRGWITFDNTVNVKEICWNLNNTRVRDSDIGAIVNRELKQRVRPISGLTVRRPVARQDVKHAAKIIQVLDGRWNLWTSSVADEKKDNEKESFGLVSQNPVLKGIADYLVDEGSYEEEALLGQKLDDDKSKEPSCDVERDSNLLSVLDKLVLYLRVVHSLDYYSAIEYASEDEMPHRCGIIHVRGPLPVGRITPTEVSDWMASFEKRILPFMNTKIFLDDSEMSRLGKKSPNEEVEKFILANTQELAKDKWLCPLSGKKFKGPDFVRKHIIAKHMEKVDEVKQEVTFFNNYLKDPKRPQLPEYTASKSTTSSAPGGCSGGGQALAPPARDGYLPPGGAFHGPLPPPPHIGYRPPPVMYQGRQAGAPPQFPSRGAPDHFRGGDFRRDRFPPRDRPPERPRESRPAPVPGPGPRSDPRGAVNYRDLDTPPDAE